MSDNSPTHVACGEQFRNAQGITAIKDGQKRRASQAEPTPFHPKPNWLRVTSPAGDRCQAGKRNVSEHRLSAGGRESPGPNAGEDWSSGTATIMLVGPFCTRACRFSAVATADPCGWPDQE